MLSRFFYVPSGKSTPKVTAGKSLYVMCSDSIQIRSAAVDDPTAPILWSQISGRQITFSDPTVINPWVFGLSSASVLDLESTIITLKVTVGTGRYQSSDILSIYTAPTSKIVKPSIEAYGLPYSPPSTVTTLVASGSIPPRSRSGSFYLGDDSHLYIGWLMPEITNLLHSTVFQVQTNGIFNDVQEHLVNTPIQQEVDIPNLVRIVSRYKNKLTETKSYSQPIWIDKDSLKTLGLPSKTLMIDSSIPKPGLDDMKGSVNALSYAFHINIVPINVNSPIVQPSIEDLAGAVMPQTYFKFARLVEKDVQGQIIQPSIDDIFSSMTHLPYQFNTTKLIIG